jgi:ribonucleoside-diphosphate reductase alpha chain
MEHDKQKNTDSKDKDVEPILKDYDEYSKGQYTCPNCGSTAYQTVSGCKICLRCGYSKCGV